MTVYRKIFFSYATENRSVVDRYVGAFEAERFDVWVDFNQIEFGDNLVERINQALENPTALIFWSHEYARKQWTRTELWALINAYVESQRPDGEKRILVPVRVDECELPQLLRPQLWSQSGDATALARALARSLDGSPRTQGGTADVPPAVHSDVVDRLNAMMIESLAAQIIPKLQSSPISDEPVSVTANVAGEGRLTLQCLPRPASDPLVEECAGLLRQCSFRSRKIQAWQDDLARGGLGVLDASMRIHLEDNQKERDETREQIRRLIKGLIL